MINNLIILIKILVILIEIVFKAKLIHISKIKMINKHFKMIIIIKTKISNNKIFKMIKMTINKNKVILLTLKNLNSIHN